MRVVGITPLYPPGSRVGAWLATHQLLRHLVQRGHEVSVFAFQSYGAPYEIDGIKVDTGSRGKQAVRHPAYPPDVVVSHMNDGGLGSRVAREAGVPNVQMQHGGVRKVHDPALAVFNSHHMREATLCDCPSMVVHPITDMDAHRVESIGDEITLDNLGIDKGVMTAWRLAERMPDHPFLGVKGGYPAGGQRIPRAANFETIPTCNDMRVVWARTRVLLMPSKYETWGMVGVEAMSNGIPVIAADLPGLRESLGDAGTFIADNDNLDAWRAQIERLDDPAEYAEAALRSRHRADELAVDFADGLERFTGAVEALAEGRPLDVQATASCH